MTTHRIVKDNIQRFRLNNFHVQWASCFRHPRIKEKLTLS